MYMDNCELSELKGNSVSLSKALEYSDDARVICHAKYPNGLLHANKAWTALTKYEQHEIEGKPLSCLHGPLTDTGRIIQMMHNVTFSGFGSTEVVNYDKNMVPFGCRISIQPIISQNCYGENRISHHMWVLEKNPDYYTAYPIPFLSQEEEEAYDWVLNADREIDYAPLRRNDREGWDDFDRPAKQARIGNKSVQAEIIRRSGSDNEDDENDHQTDNDSERSDREEKYQGDTIYRIDVVEFLPPLSPTGSNEHAQYQNDNSSVNNRNIVEGSNSNSNPPTITAETAAIVEALNLRTASESGNIHYEEEPKQDTEKAAMIFGRKMLSASVESCKEKLLKQHYHCGSTAASSYSNQGRPDLSSGSSSNLCSRRNLRGHSSSIQDI